MQARAFHSSKRLIEGTTSLVLPVNHLYCDVDRVWCCATFLPEKWEVIAPRLPRLLLACWTSMIFGVLFPFFPGKKYPRMPPITINSMSRKLCTARGFGALDPGAFNNDDTCVPVI